MKAIEQRFFTDRERLLDERDARFSQHRHESLQRDAGEALVSIDAEPDIGQRFTYCADAFRVAGLTGKFKLYSPGIFVATRSGSHFLRLIGPAGKRCEQRLRLFQFSHLPCEAAAELRLQIPQCAIERIARSAGRKQFLHRLAADPLFDLGTKCFDLFDHRSGFVILIVDAGRFASPDAAVFFQTDQKDVDMFPDIIGDTKGHDQRPLFDFDT